jgi:flagellar assembly factor FliW
VTPFTSEIPRFHVAEAAAAPIIDFPFGLIGIAGNGYALRETDSPFCWLQSLCEPTLSMPVTNPHRFIDAYTIELTDHETARLPTDDLSQAAAYATVRHDHRLGKLVLNLRAPILIFGRQGFQVINQDPAASLRAPVGA